MEKPIPSYHVYKGDVFQLVDQAVDFVLSKVDLFVGDRSQSVDVSVEYEIPHTAVTEAIVNAVAHRDYTSNGSVQVMLFRNRLEVWNPGQLPYHLSIEKLKKPHASFPANPLIAEPMYLAGYIERMGTSIPDMIKACINARLKEPEFIQQETFSTILWRKAEAILQVTTQVSGGATEQATEQVKRLLLVLQNQLLTTAEMMKLLDLRHRPNFIYNYLKPALDLGWVEMTNPMQPNDPNQQYRITGLGKKSIHMDDTPNVTPYVSPHDTPYDAVRHLIVILTGEMSRPELQEILGVKDAKHFRENYLHPAMNEEWVEMTLTGKPKSKNQKYRLTEKGIQFQTELNKQNKSHGKN